MEKALFYKEWIKTRRIFLLALVIGIVLAVYAVMGIRRIEISKGVEHVFMIMLMKDQTFVDVLRYFPLIAGIVVGIVQMYPEVMQKRLKLTLHLPYSRNRLVAIMLATGVAQLLLIFAVQIATVGMYYSTIVPHELTWRVVMTMIPWCLCGLNAYLFVTAICLEGTWRMRVILGLVAVATLCVYFKQSMPQAYDGFLLPLTVMAMLTVSLAYRSVLRFKEGRQD